MSVAVPDTPAPSRRARRIGKRLSTAAFNRVNPFEYLNALQRHMPEVHQDPARWMPWNYQAALAAAPK